MSRTLAFSVIALFVALTLVPGSGPTSPVEAQLVGDCSITPDPSTITIDVSPGSPGIGSTNVSLVNPTPHTEVITIEAQTGGLAHAVPGTVTLGPYASTNFDLSIRADQRMPYSSINGAISCTVESMDGIPNPTPTPKSAAFIIAINQFAFMRVQAEQSFQELRPRTDHVLVFTIHNDGNFLDKLNLEIANREELEEKGWSISLTAPSVEVESMSSEQVRVQVRTPKKQGWSDQYFTLQFRASSTFSETFDTGQEPESADVWVTMYVRGFYLPGFTWWMTFLPILLVGVVISARRNGPRETPRTSS